VARQRMHENQVNVDEHLVRTLLHDQFPHWASLPLQLVDSYGTEHSIYRIGDRLAGRFPLLPAAEAATTVEARWLPALAPFLPCRVPVILAQGRATPFYPFTWAVSEWIDGEDGSTAPYDELRLARDLAGFLKALESIDATGAPMPSPGQRGGLLANVDGPVRRAIQQLGDRIDGAAATRSWEESLSVSEWARAGVWLHGDPLPGNLLFQQRRLIAVIDFGGLKAGDPACDLQPAWNMFSGASRRLFRAAMDVDDATWLRGRGWTLYQAITGLNYYWDTNPRMIRQVSHALGKVLSDV
jgi:aminoglycoside phosphotransferase (APT) family kinase protein